MYFRAVNTDVVLLIQLSLLTIFLKIIALSIIDLSVKDVHNLELIGDSWPGEDF